MRGITLLRVPAACCRIPAHHEAVELAEAAGWFRSPRQVLGRVFRYGEARLVVQDLATLQKPLATALLLRFLSRGRCTVEDLEGSSLQVTAGYITRRAWRFAADRLRAPGLLRATAAAAVELGHAVEDTPRPRSSSRDLPPLYLKTDLWFNVLAGGSLTHVAGVVNNLGKFTPPPVFISASRIPLVSSEVNVHVAPPDDRYRDTPDCLAMAYNRTVLRKAEDVMAGRRASFIYHRYSEYNFAGVRLARTWRVPLVLEYNGSEVWARAKWATRAHTHAGLAMDIEMLNLRAADLVVVVSRPLRDELAARGIDPCRVLVNPNGVDVARYTPTLDGGPVRRKLGLEGMTVVGFIGTFGRWHGADVLADAFGRLIGRRQDLRARTRLLMIGDGMTMPRVRELLAGHGVADLAVLTGIVPQDKGPEHLAACDLLISPHVPNTDGTPFFGSPTKLFEYMAMGRPIVASQLDQISEVLAHAETAWMVRPGDAEDLARGMETLLDDEPLRRRLGAAARASAEQNHTWEQHTRRIVEALSPRGTVTTS